MNRLLEPRVAIAVLVIVALFAALFTPSVGDDDSDERLSSILTGPAGARGLYDIAGRLGWKVSRNRARAIPAGAERIVHAVLAPPIALSSRETRELLARVRQGDGLLVVASEGTPLADSLGLSFYSAQHLSADSARAAGCRKGRRSKIEAMMEFGVFPETFRIGARSPKPERIFVSAGGTRANPDDGHPAAIGFGLGKGRVVALAGTELLQNDVLRICAHGLTVHAVRMLEYLSEGGRSSNAIVFDEYHQGFGAPYGVTRTVSAAMTGTPPGNVIVHLLAAGSLLLLSIAPRPLAPTSRRRFARRSPFEHVEALAAAYSRIGATRLGTRRLVRGLHRRTFPGNSPGRPGSDEDFLEWVIRTHPSVAAEATQLQVSLAEGGTPYDFVNNGRSILKIERTIKREP